MRGKSLRAKFWCGVLFL